MWHQLKSPRSWKSSLLFQRDYLLWTSNPDNHASESHVPNSRSFQSTKFCQSRVQRMTKKKKHQSWFFLETLNPADCHRRQDSTSSKGCLHLATMFTAFQKPVDNPGSYLMYSNNAFDEGLSGFLISSPHQTWVNYGHPNFWKRSSLHREIKQPARRPTIWTCTLALESLPP